MLTGPPCPPVRHEDGTVRFWDASGVSLKPLYKLGTANIFQTDCEHNDSLNQAGEEEWPPFRKVRSPEPGWGDVAEDPPAPPYLHQHWRVKPRGGHGGCTHQSRPSCAPGTCPPAQHSCSVTPRGDTRDACSVCPISWVCPGAGGEPGDAWGQTFPGRDARSSPCAAAGNPPAGGLTWGCTKGGGCPAAV